MVGSALSLRFLLERSSSSHSSNIFLGNMMRSLLNFEQRADRNQHSYKRSRHSL